MLIDDLNLAIEAARSGQLEQTLAHMLDAWRGTRATPIRELIEELGVRLGRSRGPVGEAGLKRERIAEWNEVAERRDPADLDRLLGSLASLSGAVAIKRLKWLRKGPDDPRMVPALIRYVLDRQLGDMLREAALRSLVKLRDQRMAALRNEGLELDLLWNARVDPEQLGDVELEPELSEAALAAIAELASAITDSRLGLSSPECEADGATREAMFASVYAKPGRPERRAVLGDWLAERGDPRGEFITLQCLRHRRAATPASRKREKDLLTTHAREWLGPLHPVLSSQHRWDRGFLDQVALVSAFRGDEEWRALGELAVWSTVRQLDLRGERCPLPLVCAPVMRSLEVLSGLTVDDLSQFPFSVSLPVSTLRLLTRTRWTPCGRVLAKCFPTLRSLELETRGSHYGAVAAPAAGTVVSDLASAGALSRLEQLTVEDRRLSRLGRWLRELTRSGADLALTIHAPGVRTTAVCCEGWRVDTRVRRAEAFPGLMQSLASLEPGELAALRVKATPKAQPALPVDALRGEAARLGVELEM